MTSEADDPKGCFYDVLFDEPFVAVTRSGNELSYGVARTAALAAGRTAHLLISMCWYAPYQLDQILEVRARAARDHPNIHFTFMSATSADEAMFRSAGVDSIWCNHNALIDERVFYPEPVHSKLYDAVYNGRLEPLKRHELAFEVPRMAVITGVYGVERDYANRIIAGYCDLAYSNYGDGEIKLIAPPAIRQILCQSVCGLALSALEGAMLSSAEYLLCGVPVVSTPSKGGRDVFFHPDYVAIVDATPQAVAAAVAAFKAAPPDPMMIRRRTLEAFQPHRARLLMWLSAIVQRNLFPLAGENLWAPMIINPVRTWAAA